MRHNGVWYIPMSSTKGGLKMYLFLTETYPLEMCCRLDLANRLHESISDNDADIGPRVSICLLPQGYEVGL